MILNPGAKKVICFGDSLTWGHFHSGIRFPLKDRWTYKLQELLGDGYDVVEEGMRGRTTVLDDDAKPDRNGFFYLRPCIQSNTPVDHLVLFLGTNDAKSKFHLTADQIVRNIATLIDWIQNDDRAIGHATQIIVISPPRITVEFLEEDSNFDASSAKLLTDISPKLKELAESKKVSFVDLSQDLQGGKDDGIHLSIHDQNKIAERIASTILPC